MTLKIKQYDKDIQRLTQIDYHETQAMMTIHGIGHAERQDKRKCGDVTEFSALQFGRSVALQVPQAWPGVSFS